MRRFLGGRPRTGARLAVALAALSLAATGVPPLARADYGARPARAYDARMATEWFRLLYDAVREEKLPPMVAARVYGYAAVALYESLVPGMPQHRSLAGQLNQLPPLPATRQGRAYHWPAVANTAMAEVVRGLMPEASAPTLAAIGSLRAELDAAYPGVPPTVRTWSVAQGRAVARAILNWAAGDGYATLSNCPYTPPVGPGTWTPTPPAYGPPLQPCWGRLRPFALASGVECAAPPPPPFSPDSRSAFYAEAYEVYLTGRLGAGLTDEQKAIAHFWADDPAVTGTPAGHWVSIVGQVAEERNLSLEDAAEAYARVGIGVADAFIACWATKYQYNLLRPVTYIQLYIDPAWLPLLATPPFPEYTSGHSTQSGAAVLLLTDMLGAFRFTDRTHEFRGLAARTFSSFEEAADEAAISRLYGGIHYRAAIDLGLAQGRCVGQAILNRVEFRR